MNLENSTHNLKFFAGKPPLFTIYKALSNKFALSIDVLNFLWCYILSLCQLKNILFPERKDEKHGSQVSIVLSNWNSWLAFLRNNGNLGWAWLGLIQEIRQIKTQTTCLQSTSTIYLNIFAVKFHIFTRDVQRHAMWS